VEAAPETHTETSTEVYFFLQDTLRIAYEMAREATAEARHPGLAAAAAAAAQVADELAHLEGAGEGGDLDEARELITAIPPRGRPAAEDPAEELFASSTSSPATLLQAEADEAAEADWYDQKEWERSGP
jgi:hypothetical protein